MLKWEYLSIDIYKEQEDNGKHIEIKRVAYLTDREIEVDELLEILGNQGWELCAIATETGSIFEYDFEDKYEPGHLRVTGWCYHFKRMKE